MKNPRLGRGMFILQKEKDPAFRILFHLLNEIRCRANWLALAVPS